MGYFWPRFRRRAHFLGNYLLLHAALLTTILALLYAFDIGIKVAMPMAWYPLLLPVILYAGLRIPTIMHNCMHGNLPFGNWVVGELSAFFVLMSFGVVCTQHALHHAYPDTEMDPHSPEGLTFWQFFFYCQFRGVGAVEQKYLQFHGRTPERLRWYRVTVAAHFLGNVLRLGLWMQILGPLFLPVYVPAFLAYLFVFAHVNYSTHGRDANGNSVVVNTESNFYHRVVNYVCDGVYFHENHHRFPRRYNPKFSR